jgi:hypothetical protein
VPQDLAFPWGRYSIYGTRDGLGAVYATG